MVTPGVVGVSGYMSRPISASVSASAKDGAATNRPLRSETAKLRSDVAEARCDTHRLDHPQWLPSSSMIGT